MKAEGLASANGEGGVPKSARGGLPEAGELMPWGGSTLINPGIPPLFTGAVACPRLARLGRVGAALWPVRALRSISGSTRSWKSRRALFSTLRKPTSVTQSISRPIWARGAGDVRNSFTVPAGSVVVIQAGTTMGSNPSSAMVYPFSRVARLTFTGAEDAEALLWNAGAGWAGLEEGGWKPPAERADKESGAG